MIIRPELHVLLVTDENNGPGTLWPGFGAGMDHLRLTVTSAIPPELEDVHAVITTGGSTGTPAVDRLLQFVRAGGAWLALVGLSDRPIPDAFGVQPGPVGPRSELRLLFTDRFNPIGARLPDAVYIDGCYQPLQVIAEGVETAKEHHALRQIGVRLGQGYLYSRPAAAFDQIDAIVAGSAVTMPEAEQRDRMRSLRATVRERNVFRWAGFMLLDAARIRRRERIEARLLTHTENA